MLIIFFPFYFPLLVKVLSAGRRLRRARAAGQPSPLSPGCLRRRPRLSAAPAPRGGAWRPGPAPLRLPGPGYLSPGEVGRCVGGWAVSRPGAACGAVEPEEPRGMALFTPSSPKMSSLSPRCPPGMSPSPKPSPLQPQTGLSLRRTAPAPWNLCPGLDCWQMKTQPCSRGPHPPSHGSFH